MMLVCVCCFSTSSGSAAVPVVALLEGLTGSALPPDFVTRCSGLCGGPGWRARTHGADSGFHADNDVESVLSLSKVCGHFCFRLFLTVGGFFSEKVFQQDGSISFLYTVDARSGGLEFFIDGVRQAIFRTEESTIVSFPVAKGNRTFVWLYDQDEGVEGRVTIERLLLQVFGGEECFVLQSVKKKKNRAWKEEDLAWCSVLQGRILRTTELWSVCLARVGPFLLLKLRAPVSLASLEHIRWLFFSPLLFFLL
jgi:hypothetical protein